MASAVASPPYFSEDGSSISLDMRLAIGDDGKLRDSFRSDIGHDMGDQFIGTLRDTFKNHVSNFSDSVGKDTVMRYVGITHNDIPIGKESTPPPQTPFVIGVPDMDDGSKALEIITTLTTSPLLGKSFSDRNDWSRTEKEVFAKNILALITAIHLDGDGNNISKVLDVMFNAENIKLEELYEFCKPFVSADGFKLRFTVYYDSEPIIVERKIRYSGTTDKIPLVSTSVTISGKPIFTSMEMSIDSPNHKFTSSVTTLTTIVRSFDLLNDVNSRLAISSPDLNKIVKDNYVKRSSKTLGTIKPEVLAYISSVINSGISNRITLVEMMKSCCAVKTSCDSSKALLTESLKQIYTTFRRGTPLPLIGFFTGDILAFTIFGNALKNYVMPTIISSYGIRKVGTDLHSYTLRNTEAGIVSFNQTITGISTPIGISDIISQGGDYDITVDIVNRLLNSNTVGTRDEKIRNLFSILKQVKLEERKGSIFTTDGSPNKIFFAFILKILKTDTLNLRYLFGPDYLGSLVKLMEMPFPIGDAFRTFAGVTIGVCRTKIIETILFTVCIGFFRFYDISPPEGSLEKNVFDYVCTLVFYYLYQVFFNDDISINEKIVLSKELFMSFLDVYGPDPLIWKVTITNADKYKQFYTEIGSRSPKSTGFGKYMKVPERECSRIRGSAALLYPPVLTSRKIEHIVGYAVSGSSQGQKITECIPTLSVDINRIDTYLTIFNERLSPIFTGNSLV